MNPDRILSQFLPIYSSGEVCTAFTKDKLNFFTDDMYYPFRNNLILAYSRYLKKPTNMRYLMNTIALYTYDDASDTPCPYKLLIGSETGSKLVAVIESLLNLA